MAGAWLAALSIAGCRRPDAAPPPSQPNAGPSAPGPGGAAGYGGASAPGGGAPSHSAADPAAIFQAGKASYYADSLAGRPTASGEPYDPRAMTAAHRTLPFGTLVLVERADTGRRVLVRINDRGPFGGKGRVIDLSRSAAESLDMMKAGVVDVTLRVTAQ